MFQNENPHHSSPTSWLELNQEASDISRENLLWKEYGMRNSVRGWILPPDSCILPQEQSPALNSIALKKK